MAAAAAATATAAVVVTVAASASAATASALLLLLSIGGKIDAEPKCHGRVRLAEDGQHLVGSLFATLKDRIALNFYLDLLETTQFRIVRIVAGLCLKAGDDSPILFEEAADFPIGFKFGVDFVKISPLGRKFDGVCQLRAG